MFSRQIDTDLKLRLPEERHAGESFVLVRENLEHLREWLPWVHDGFTLADSQNFIRQNLRQFAEQKGFSVQIVSGEVIAGQVGYNTIDWAHRRTEIGYWLGASFQGRGLMTRACRALIDHAFGELKLNRVEISCATGNRRSRMIPERLGFTREGVLRQAEWVHDHFNDLVVYGLLAHEWKESGR